MLPNPLSDAHALEQFRLEHFAKFHQKCKIRHDESESVKKSLAGTIDRIRSLSLFVPEDSPHLVFRLEAAEKIDEDDPGFSALLDKIYRALALGRAARKPEVVDLWALDLWEYNRKEYDYFNQHPERFTGFSECGIARILSHIALTLALGGPTYLFVMYNMAKQTIDLKGEVESEDYETFLEALPF